MYYFEYNKPVGRVIIIKNTCYLNAEVTNYASNTPNSRIIKHMNAFKLICSSHRTSIRLGLVIILYLIILNYIFILPLYSISFFYHIIVYE